MKLKIANLLIFPVKVAEGRKWWRQVSYKSTSSPHSGACDKGGIDFSKIAGNWFYSAKRKRRKKRRLWFGL